MFNALDESLKRGELPLCVPRPTKATFPFCQVRCMLNRGHSVSGSTFLHSI